MRPDPDDVSAVVQAFSFELIGPSGTVVADLGSVDGPPPRSSLDLIHDAPNVGNTRLDWTTGGDRSPWNAARLMGPDSSGQPSDPSQIAGSANGNLILAESEVTFPDAVAAGIRAGSPTVEDGLGPASGGLPSSEMRVRRTPTTTSARIASYGAGGTSGAVTDVLPGLSSMLAYTPGNGFPSVQVVPPNVNLNPASNGRVTLNGRPTYQLLSVQQYNAPANVTVGYRSFLMNGITPPNAGIVGDVYEICAVTRVLCVVAGGAFLAEYQGFGGGAGISAQRIVATQWAANHDATLSATWAFEQTVAGAITWTIVGGNTAGVWTMVAPDSWFIVRHYGIR